MKQKFFVSGIIASLVAIVYLLSFSKKESVQVTYDVQRPIQQRLLKIRRHIQPAVKPAVVQPAAVKPAVVQPAAVKPAVVQPVVKPPPPVESIVYPSVTKSAAASLITVPDLNVPDLNVPDLNESASPFDFQTPPVPPPVLPPAAPPPPAMSPTAAAAFTTAAAVRSRPRRLTGSISAKPVLAKIPEIIASRSSAFTSILDL
jgi:hypothetical protein